MFEKCLTSVSETGWTNVLKSKIMLPKVWQEKCKHMGDNPCQYLKELCKTGCVPWLHFTV